MSEDRPFAETERGQKDRSEWMGDAPPGEEEKLRQSRGNGPDTGTRGALHLRYGFETTKPQSLGTLVKGVLHIGSISLIYGPPKSGKSFLATSLAATVVDETQKDWMGHKIVRHGPVLYIACEGHAGFWKRCAAEAKERGWTEATFPQGFILATGRPTLIQIDAKGMHYAPNPADILAAIEDATRKGLRPVAIIIDTVFRSFGAGNVNASPDMNVYLAAVSVLTDQGHAVALVHHETKTGQTPAGSVALIGGSDTIINVWRHAENKDQRFWQVEMAKDDAETDPHAFTLKWVDVGFDLDGEEASSCVVIDGGASPDAAKGRRGRGRPTSPSSDAAVFADLVYQELCNLLANPNEGREVIFKPGMRPTRAVERSMLRLTVNQAGIMVRTPDDADQKDRRRIANANDQKLSRALNRLKGQQKVVLNEQWIGLPA
jgi:hypothetical protein